MKLLLVSISLEFPLAIYCLAAQVLSNPSLNGCSVKVLDLDWKRMSSYERKNAEIWKYLAEVEQLQPDVIGFSVYLWDHLATSELVRITNLLFPSIRIVIGGPEVATPEATEMWLQTGAVSVVVRGEGERTFEEVLQRLAQGDDTRGVFGTSRYSSGLIVHEEARPPIKVLAELPSPILNGLVPADLFDREEVPPQSAPYARALMETYRGCYMHCSYCQWGNGSKACFAFPEERLQREITWLLSHHIRTIFFIDAMFGFKKAAAIDLLEHIVSEKRRLGANTQFVLYHNQDFFDPYLFDLYREAGVSIEVDLQSTNRDVLNRLGRGRWHTDSFDRHLTAIREQRIPTTGGADLIIGIPGDDLESFQESVDFLLRREMQVRLYQGSILPDTGWSRSIKQDGTVFSPLPPRAILKNDSFSLRDMITARLIGHGTDFFNNFPRTAGVLWRRWFKRPVDLCRVVGESVFRNYGLMFSESHQYDQSVWILGGYLESLADMIRTVCPDPQKAEILVELLQFEGALAAMT
ncbi:MAG: B12-binding domain-containing radical SAM protein, partial [Halobacteriota archaeon]